MPRRSYISKHVKWDQRDKSDTSAILMRRTNAGYRLRVRRYREKVRELTRLYAQIKNARMSLLKASFGALGCTGNQLSDRRNGRSAPKRKRAEPERAHRTNAIMRDAKGKGRRGRVRVYNFLWGGKFHSRSFRFECATTTHAFKRGS